MFGSEQVKLQFCRHMISMVKIRTVTRLKNYHIRNADGIFLALDKKVVSMVADSFSENQKLHDNVNGLCTKDYENRL